MKIELPYTFFKDICLSLCDQLQAEFHPELILAVSRGGITAAHIMAKRLKLPVGYLIPPGKDETQVQLCIPGGPYDNIVVVEDLVAKGRTYELVQKALTSINENLVKEEQMPFTWEYVPILIDSRYEGDFKYYGFKSPHWIVFPYEEIDAAVEFDWGLSRLGNEKYGKLQGF